MGKRQILNQEQQEWLDAFNHHYNGSYYLIDSGDGIEFDTMQEAICYAERNGFTTIFVESFEYEDRDGEFYEYCGGGFDLDGNFIGNIGDDIL